VEWHVKPYYTIPYLSSSQVIESFLAERYYYGTLRLAYSMSRPPVIYDVVALYAESLDFR